MLDMQTPRIWSHNEELRFFVHARKHLGGMSKYYIWQFAIKCNIMGITTYEKLPERMNLLFFVSMGVHAQNYAWIKNNMAKYKRNWKLFHITFRAILIILIIFAVIRNAVNPQFWFYQNKSNRFLNVLTPQLPLPVDYSGFWDFRKKMNWP